MRASLTALLDRVPPQILVLLSRALQALAAPVVALLVATSEQIASELPDAISFCNVLFVGNLCAGLVVITSFGPRRIVTDLRALPRGSYFELLLFAALSALLSTLIYTAIESTTVTNIVLLARLGPVLFVFGAALVFGQLISRSEAVGFGFIGLGVLAAVFSSNGLTVARGDVLILCSTVVYAMVTIMSKRLLPVAGLPALVFIRNVVSAMVFFVIASVLYGVDHFADAFYGPLWGIMLVYALVIIVFAQIAWYRGVGQLSPASIARWTLMTPVIAVGYAYLLNGERPSSVQLSALAFIMLGVLISNIGKFTPKGASDNPENSVAAS